MAMRFSEQQIVGRKGSLDGTGAGDHDQPYSFGRRPNASTPYPFNTHEYARLLVLRGRVQDALAERRAYRASAGLHPLFTQS